MTKYPLLLDSYFEKQERCVILITGSCSRLFAIRNQTIAMVVLVLMSTVITVILASSMSLTSFTLTGGMFLLPRFRPLPISTRHRVPYISSSICTLSHMAASIEKPGTRTSFITRLFVNHCKHCIQLRISTSSFILTIFPIPSHIPCPSVFKGHLYPSSPLQPP